MKDIAPCKQITLIKLQAYFSILNHETLINTKITNQFPMIRKHNNLFINGLLDVYKNTKLIILNKKPNLLLLFISKFLDFIRIIFFTISKLSTFTLRKHTWLLLHCLSSIYQQKGYTHLLNHHTLWNGFFYIIQGFFIGFFTSLAQNWRKSLSNKNFYQMSITPDKETN